MYVDMGEGVADRWDKEEIIYGEESVAKSLIHFRISGVGHFRGFGCDFLFSRRKDQLSPIFGGLENNNFGTENRVTPRGAKWGS